MGVLDRGVGQVSVSCVCCWPQLLRQLYAFDNKTFAFLYLAEVVSRVAFLSRSSSPSFSLSLSILLL